MNDDDQLIFRIEHTKGFTVVSNSVLCDSRLSWKARGLLVFLLSKPNNWRTVVAHLVTQSPSDGKASVTSGLQELQTHGYLTKRRRPPVKGKFDGWDILIHESPDETESDNQIPTASDLPSPVNQTLQRTDLQNTDLQKKEENLSICDYEVVDLAAESRRLDDLFPARKLRRVNT